MPMDLSAWDIALLAAASYFAVIVLVWLMRSRRNEILRELTRDLEAEQKRLKTERMLQRRKQIQKQIEEQRRARRAA